MVTLASILTLGYLLGSIPSALIAGRAIAGIDVREQGSGNAGAANVLRLLGFKAALGVLLADIGKGWLAVVLVSRLRLDALPVDPVWVPLAAGLAAIAGHLWPVYAGFRGGKGVATGAGVMLALYPWTVALSAVCFVVAVALTRRIAVGSLVGAISMPRTLFVQARAASTPVPGLDVGFALLVAVVIVACHHRNIRNLVRGVEPRIRF